MDDFLKRMTSSSKGVDEADEILFAHQITLIIQVVQEGFVSSFTSIGIIN